MTTLNVSAVTSEAIKLDKIGRRLVVKSRYYHKDTPKNKQLNAVAARLSQSDPVKPFTDQERVDYSKFLKNNNIYTYGSETRIKPRTGEAESYIKAARLARYLHKTEAELEVCPVMFMLGADSVGHRFAKELFCSREWCPVCGKQNSKAHNRRSSAWWVKVQQLKTFGYWVIEFPLKERLGHHSKSQLETDGKLITSVLKGDYALSKRRAAGEIIRSAEVAEIKAKYFDKGLRRWHFFGDPPKGLESGQVQSMLYNPHLNVITASARIDPKQLKLIKSQLREAFGVPDLIVHYLYADTPGKMVHLVKYITRSTFLNSAWDEFLAGSLFGFRNMHSWGKFNGPEVWNFKDLKGKAKAELNGVNVVAVAALGESKCPIDGLPIIWSKPMPIRWLNDLRVNQSNIIEDYGAGFYRLTDVPLDIGMIPDYQSPDISLPVRDRISLFNDVLAETSLAFSQYDVREGDWFKNDDFVQAALPEPPPIAAGELSAKNGLWPVIYGAEDPPIDLDLDISDLDQDIL